MLADRIEGKWIDAFCELFEKCAVKKGDTAAILSETQSRQLNVQLAELALLRLGARPFHVVVPTPRNRLSGADPLDRRQRARSASSRRWSPRSAQAGFVVDCTLEGLMHAPETPDDPQGRRPHHGDLERAPRSARAHAPDPALEGAGAQRRRACCAASKRMKVTSAAGTDLDVDMEGAQTVGIWGWTEKPGTLAHWPGGIVVSFPKAKSVNGTLVLDRGDVNLTFKRYMAEPIRLDFKDDYITDIIGEGTDAEMFRKYLAAWGDREAYAVSHVGFGMNPGARYEALSMYGQRDTNGTEIRAVPGNFLFSTGANEFAGRYTAGHFDLPVMKTTIALDNTIVVKDGVLQL